MEALRQGAGTRRLWLGVGVTFTLMAAFTSPARAGQAQTITFQEIDDLRVNDADYAVATATSGLEVEFTSDTPATCVMQGTGVQARQAGTCTITATQPGNGSWDPAPPVSRSLTIEKGAVQQGTAKPKLANQLGDPVVLDFVVRPKRAWEGQVDPTGTYNIVVQSVDNTVYADETLPFDPESGLGKYVFNDPPRVPALDPGWFVEFGCYSGDANYVGQDQECGAMGDPFQMYRKPTTTKMQVTPSPVKYGDPVKATVKIVDEVGNPVKADGATVYFEWRANDPWSGVEVPAEDGEAAIIVTNYDFGSSVPFMAQYFDPSSEYGTSWHSPGISVVPGDQTITFEPLYDVEIKQSQALIIDSNTDNPIDVVADTPKVCEIDDDVVKALALGTCSLTASQDASDEWNEAKPVTRSFDVLTDAPSLTYPDGQTVVGRPLAALTPQIFGLKGTLTFQARGLPDGLSVNKRTGVVSGTPTTVTSGAQAVSVVASNEAGRKAGGTFRMDILPLPYRAQLAYPDGLGQVGATFTALRPHATGFNGPVKFWIDQPVGPSPAPANGLPAGLTLDGDTGAITGTPLEAGTFSATVKASDGTAVVSAQVAITIRKNAPKPTLSYPRMVKTTTGVRMDPARPHAVGLGKLVSYSAAGLPKGLRVVKTTGVVRGTPTKPGKYTVKAKARGSKGSAATSFRIRVAKSPLRASLSYPDVRVRVRDRLAPVVPVVTGLPGKVRFTAQKLPAGLNLAKATGALSGHPTKKGTFTVRVRANGDSGSASTRFITQVMPRK